MTNNEILGLLALLTGIVNWTIYLRSILAGQTRPHLFTWLVWVITGTIAAAAMITGGGGPGTWASIGAAIYFLLVFLLCFKYGSRDANWIDRASLIASLAAIPLWAITSSPLGAVILVTLVDALGFIPTIRKTWHDPYSGNMASYGWAVIRLGCTLLALENFNLITALYTGSFLILVVLFIGMTLWRRRVFQAVA